MKSGRFDEAEDERLVADALQRAVEAGVDRAEIDAVFVRAAHEPDDDLRAPVLAGRLHTLARARSPRPPMVMPLPWPGNDG
jgi:hypothetical protein